ncbi:MAG: 2-oxo acid dehydrogenase subunit E2 [Alicyclobacillus sp.]|nr:2-oxo acid dehydrogenase subunit E2 [Alicyclobacillus sp.]
MAADVIMPALELAQDTGTLHRWLRRHGEAVEKGEPIAEVESDKITFELEAPATGRLHIVADVEGKAVPVGQVIARILTEGEAAAAGEGSFAAPAQAAESAQRAGSRESAGEPEGRERVRTASSDGSAESTDVAAADPGEAARVRPLAAGAESGARRPASPKARRLAREYGLNLEQLIGSGPGGAVVAADVVAAAETARVEELRKGVAAGYPRLTPKPASPPSLRVESDRSALDSADAGRDPEVIPLSALERTAVERLSQGWIHTPHFYLSREVRAAGLVAWRNSVVQRVAGVTYTDLLIRLVAAALRRHPRVRAHWVDGGIAVVEEVNVGIAVAVPDGLVVPVIRGADRLSLRDISEARRALVERAQAGHLRPEDVRGGTFTISNLGMYGIDAFHAIVNPGQAAILAVGRVAERVVARDGQAVVEPVMHLALSCDHRVLDGVRAAEFLRTLAEWVEDPLGLLD